MTNRTVLLLLVVVVLTMAKEEKEKEEKDKKCKKAENYPEDWKPLGGTSEAGMKRLWHWVKLLGVTKGYDCKWDNEACKKDFISADKEKEICDKCKKEAKGDPVAFVICAGKAVRAEFKKKAPKERSRCWKYADRLREILENCGPKGIKIDFQSAYDKDLVGSDGKKGVGHSWLRLTITKKDGTVVTMLADPVNRRYIMVSPAGGKARAASVLVEDDEETDESECFHEPRCPDPCSPLTTSPLEPRLAGEDMVVPLSEGSGGFGAGTLLGVPDGLGSATQYSLPTHPKDKWLELACCCENGCYAFISFYRCGPCSDPIDGDVSGDLMENGWELMGCGPVFSCSNGGDFHQHTWIFRKYLAEGEVEHTPVAAEMVPFLGLWGSCDYISWSCPGPWIGPHFGRPCVEHCC